MSDTATYVIHCGTHSTPIKLSFELNEEASQWVLVAVDEHPRTEPYKWCGELPNHADPSIGIDWGSLECPRCKAPLLGNNVIEPCGDCFLHCCSSLSRETSWCCANPSCEIVKDRELNHKVLGWPA